MYYNYFIPTIHLGPISGSKFVQNLPMDKIREAIVGKNAILEIRRNIFKDGNLLYTAKDILKLDNNNWQDSKGHKFIWDSNYKKDENCYIETQINMISGHGFISPSLPGFYVWYINSKNKNFISCGNDKYGNPRVIMQMEKFGLWIDGYPAVNINKKNDITYSVIIINPYDLKGKFHLEINELKIKKTYLVNPRSVIRIALEKIINVDNWTGQVYITGKQRGIIYFMNHSLKNSQKINTLEHSDPFRAELTFKPRFMNLRDLAHKKLKKILF